MINTTCPTSYTCSKIDDCIRYSSRVIDEIDSAKDYLNSLQTNLVNEDYSQAISYLERIEGYLSTAEMYADIESDLEELRVANSSLREWGTEMAEEVERLQKQLNQIKQIID